MKRWQGFLLRFLLWSSISVIALTLLLYLFLWWYLNSNCGHNTFTFSAKGGDVDAIVDDECCDWGCKETITLHGTHGWGLDTEIFVYKPTHADRPPGTPWTHDPVVTWLSPHDLEISVDRIGHIYSQKTKAREVSITYRIGSVDEP
jgi:hypothetical protein